MRDPTLERMDAVRSIGATHVNICHVRHDCHECTVRHAQKVSGTLFTFALAETSEARGVFIRRAIRRIKMFPVRILVMMAVLLAAPPMASAQEPPVRVRGTIDRVEGDIYVVKARSGGEVKVRLADNAMVVALTK